MRLRGWFIILIILLCTTIALLIVQTFVPQKFLFYLTELLVAIIIAYLFFFYRKVINPIRVIGNGLKLLKEQDFSSRLRHVNQKDADRIVDVFNRMITQLKDERLHVRETNQFLDLLINASPLGVVILDLDGHFSSMNPAAEKFLEISISETKGKKISEIGSPLSDNLSSLGKDSSSTFQLNDSHIYRCSRLSFIDRGYAHPFYLIESLTEEVMNAEKKAYEKVIRMIAHEVNNTTAGVTSTLDSLCDMLKDTPDSTDIRDVMSACIERCYSMSNFITRFADVVKIPQPQLMVNDLNQLADNCIQTMETKCAENNIRIHKNFAEGQVLVNVDSELIEQVIVNIIKNATESIGQDGDIYCKTSSSPTILEIADTGEGISEDTQKKLFSPFFSTKPNGQGIGLIFIREVLIKHNCRFSLKTYADGITRFRIEFVKIRD